MEYKLSTKECIKKLMRGYTSALNEEGVSSAEKESGL